MGGFTRHFLLWGDREGRWPVRVSNHFNKSLTSCGPCKETERNKGQPWLFRSPRSLSTAWALLQPAGCQTHSWHKQGATSKNFF